MNKPAAGGETFLRPSAHLPSTTVHLFCHEYSPALSELTPPGLWLASFPRETKLELLPQHLVLGLRHTHPLPCYYPFTASPHPPLALLLP